MESKSDHLKTFAVFIDAAVMVGAFAASIGTVVVARRLTPFGSWQADLLDDALLGSVSAAVSVAIPLALSRRTWIERTWFLFAGVWMIVAWQAGREARGVRGDVHFLALVCALCEIVWASVLGVLMRVLTGLFLRRECDDGYVFPSHRFALKQLLLLLTACGVTLAAFGWVFPRWSSEDTRVVRAILSEIEWHLQFIAWGITITTVAGAVAFRWRLIPSAFALSLVALTLWTLIGYWPGRLPGLRWLGETVLLQTVRFVWPGVLFAIPPLIALHLRGYQLTKSPQ